MSSTVLILFWSHSYVLPWTVPILFVKHDHTLSDIFPILFGSFTHCNVMHSPKSICNTCSYCVRNSSYIVWFIYPCHVIDNPNIVWAHTMSYTVVRIIYPCHIMDSPNIVGDTCPYQFMHSPNTVWSTMLCHAQF